MTGTTGTATGTATGPANDRPAAQTVATMVRTVTAGELSRYRDVVRSVVGSPAHDATPTASPVHAFVLAHPAFEQAFTKTGATTADGGEPARVHLSQEIRLDRPLRPDERVIVEVDLLGARHEAGGVRVAMRAVLVGTDGTTFGELITGALLGGATSPEPFGDLPRFPMQRVKSTPDAWTREFTVDDVRQYATASGDDNPIHLEDAAARAAGFDGVIAHGMSVLAVVCEEIADRHAGGDISRIGGVGVRFSAPVRPGEPLEISTQADGDLVCFGVKTADGVALKGGWVRLSAQPSLLTETDATNASG
jgi:acyl dehydratase